MCFSTFERGKSLLDVINYEVVASVFLMKIQLLYLCLHAFVLLKNFAANINITGVFDQNIFLKTPLLMFGKWTHNLVAFNQGCVRHMIALCDQVQGNFDSDQEGARSYDERVGSWAATTSDWKVDMCPSFFTESSWVADYEYVVDICGIDRKTEGLFFLYLVGSCGVGMLKFTREWSMGQFLNIS